ncbi:MAG: hypothetical protein Tsb0020_37730 [Haliangiales bacterium]
MARNSSIPWLVRWLSAAPSRWLGRSSAVHQDIASGTQGIAYLRQLVRGNRLRRASAFDEVPTGTNPILVIHGFLSTRGSMLLLEKRLVEDGFCVFSFNLGPLNVRDIRRSAFLIHRKIERILAQTSWRELDIVAHSMGGLIGLYYIKKLGGHSRVRRLVTLGTPYRGTWVALGGVAAMGLLSTSTWQLLPRSSFLDELHRGQIPEGVDVYSIAAARDWLCPPSATRVRGVKAITVPYGHSGLVVSPDVYQRVKSILRPDALGASPIPHAADRAHRVDRASGELAERGPGEVTSASLTSRRGEENA